MKQNEIWWDEIICNAMKWLNEKGNRMSKEQNDRWWNEMVNEKIDIW